MYPQEEALPAESVAALDNFSPPPGTDSKRSVAGTRRGGSGVVMRFRQVLLPNSDYGIVSRIQGKGSDTEIAAARAIASVCLVERRSYVEFMTR